ncbi:MAG: hypothetical protein ACTXOO_03495 [Sodalis sp. (in: enterobacteria)]
MVKYSFCAGFQHYDFILLVFTDSKRQQKNFDPIAVPSANEVETILIRQLSINNGDIGPMLI